MYREISTAHAPAAVGHYSQAVFDGRYLFVSGQIAIDPATGKMVDGGAERQMERVLSNIGAILEQAGGTFANVVKSTIFFADANDWPVLNRVYAQRLGSHRPARSAVPTGTLPFGAVVEVEVIARLGDASNGCGI